MPAPFRPLPVRFVLAIFLGVVLLQLPIDFLMHQTSFAWGLFFNEAVVFLALPLAAMEIAGYPLRDVIPSGTPSEGRLLLSVVLTFAGAILLAYFENTGAALLPVPKFLADQQVQAVEVSSPFDIFGLLLLLCILAPVCEEFLFRGIIQNAIARRRGRWTGILISAIFFALIHSTSFTPYLYLLLGLVFAWIFDVTGSLRIAILCHIINNSWIFIDRIYGLRFPLSRPFEGLDYAILASAGGVLLVCIRLLERRRRVRSQTLTPD